MPQTVSNTGITPLAKESLAVWRSIAFHATTNNVAEFTPNNSANYKGAREISRGRHQSADRGRRPPSRPYPVRLCRIASVRRSRVRRCLVGRSDGADSTAVSIRLVTDCVVWVFLEVCEDVGVPTGDKRIHGRELWQ